MSKEKIKQLLALSFDLIILSLESYCLCNFINYLIKGNLDNRFRYYTNISNLAIGLIALVDIVFIVIALIRNNNNYPKFLSILKYIAVSMSTLTFVVILFVSPFYGIAKSYSGVKIITHLIAPVLALVSYFLFSKDRELKWSLSFLGVVPIIIYIVIYVINVVIINKWDDIYKINSNGLWFVFAIIAIIISLVVSEGLFFIKKLTQNNKKQH